MIELITCILLFTIASAAYYLRIYRRPASDSSSVLLSFFTQDTQPYPVFNRLLPSGAGHIRLLISRAAVASDDIWGTIDIVYLHFTTDLHLLAIPTGAGIRLNPSLGDSRMEAVELEGDFPDYFHLYANKEQGTQVRYIMDPKAMAYVVDVSEIFDWELVNNDIVFISKDGMGDDQIEQFIAEIRPAIEVSADTVDPRLRPEYKYNFGKRLTCPLCAKNTVKQANGLYECPDGHGHLVTGGELATLPRHGLKNVFAGKNTEVVLKCPNCGQQMVKVLYDNLTIDSCINCPFRWLDAGELIP